MSQLNAFRNQMVPFSSQTYSNKQWEVKTVAMAQEQPAVRSSQTIPD